MHFHTRLLVMSSGERLPLLCDETGQPLTSPLVYALTVLRARGRSSATIRQCMHAVMVLLKTLALQGIDLEARMARGQFLQLQEVDLIAREASQRVGSIGGITSDPVGRASAATRLHYMQAYLHWLGQRHLYRDNTRGTRYLELKDRIDKTCSAMRARAPSVGVRSDVDQRQGLDAEDFERVDAASKGEASVALWRNAHAIARNKLILRWFIELGIRRGELLGLRVGDIDFQKNIVLIARRADAPDDPRTHQPLTKTQARALHISDDLAQATHDYILNARGAQGRAAQHDILFVAGGSGRPLSIAGLNKMFVEMRRADRLLPSLLSPHLLRHTWNDRFSALMEESNVPPEREKRIRSTLMGWSQTSDTASTYTRRHVRRAAARAISAMQQRLDVKASKS